MAEFLKVIAVIFALVFGVPGLVMWVIGPPASCTTTIPKTDSARVGQ